MHGDCCISMLNTETITHKGEHHKMLKSIDFPKGVRLPEISGSSPTTEKGSDGATELLKYIVGLGMRQSSLIIASLIVSLLAAVLYLVVTPPVYKATGTITVEIRKAGVSFGDTATPPIQEPEGFLEIIKSGKISTKVIQDLGLDKDPELLAPRNGTSQMLRRARILIGLPTRAVIPEPSQALHQALLTFRTNLEVKRLGPQALEISFRSVDPERAAAVVNAVVDAFIADQVEATQLSAESSGVWLQERITKLRADAEIAEQAVVDFKRQNQLVEVDGKILNDQRLTEINSQLIAVRVQRAELASKSQSLREAIGTGREILVADIKPTETLNRARQQLADLLARERDWVIRYGADHSAVANLRTQIHAVRNVVASEFGELAATYERDLEAAGAKQKALETAYAEAVALSHATGQLQVNLRELESTAKTYRTLHDTFLQRHTAAVQQESFPSSAARLLTRAEPPLYSSSPIIPLIFGTSIVIGSILGFASGFAREQLCRVMRTPEDVARKMGAACIGALPEVERGMSAQQRRLEMLHLSLLEPNSDYTEAMRSIIFGLDRVSGLKGMVIGVTSPSAEEGKSVIAANLADLLALSGRRTILVDCHLRRPALSEHLSPGAQAGLISVVLGITNLHDSIQGRYPEADFLPAGNQGPITHLNELLGSPGMLDLTSALRSSHNFIILDLPPVSQTSETRTAASYVDVILLVVECGKTQATDGMRAMQALQLANGQQICILLNKVGVDPISKRCIIQQEPRPGIEQLVDGNRRA